MASFKVDLLSFICWVSSFLFISGLTHFAILIQDTRPIVLDTDSVFMRSTYVILLVIKISTKRC